MDAALEQQLRRELLVRFQEEGGQASWCTLPLWEFEMLQQMEQEGVIERVQETGQSSKITYRLKPKDADKVAGY